MTTAGGYLVAPGAIDISCMVSTCVGTSLAIASANSINQYLEVDSDILMRRTAGRVLPTGELSLNHALAFGIITGITGSSILAIFVNETAAILALTNILLYTLVYTPLKRIHWINTWVGAVVGGIPPMIGWVANTGFLDPGAWILFYALFIWQIPHFLSLSWPLTNDYARAGYKMLTVTNPDKVPAVTLRNSLYLLPIAPAAVYFDMVSWPFAVTSTLLNSYLIYQSIGFYRTKSNIDARKTFMASLLYLTILLLLFLIHKKSGYKLKRTFEDIENNDENVVVVEKGESVTQQVVNN
eukprot:TRINITY_DN2224_c0_g1_i1.p1 TRINITY_DN2224_c0_g1~~TRINITY_DN2224_c0_g1_i1.p1  ORF type:complete len:297 (+),score=15.18 TRINITY_DN2224_c0_g1_i1:353-1243(+)